MQKRRLRYFRMGLTAFFTVAALLLFYDTLFGSRTLIKMICEFYQALKPVFYGVMLAYLLAPVINFFDKRLFSKAMERVREERKLYAPGPRAVSMVITFVLMSILVYVLLSFLLPELYKSVVQLAGNLENYYNTVNSWIQKLLDQNPYASSWLSGKLDLYYHTLLDWITTEALPQAQQLITAVTGGVASVVNFTMDLLVGIIVSVYLLFSKERLAAHGRKLLYSFFSQEQTRFILQGVHKTDSIFSGFVRGKLLDSLIIGIICFVGTSILHFPYAIIVSVIVGVTNVIPFFGPFLGAIPSFFLILLASPIKALYFLLFILALQQVDGNIIGPAILGNRTGISSLWVITAILVGGHFFGVPGMFFGVPVFACLYTALTYLVNTRLRKKDLPVESEAYRTDIPQALEQAAFSAEDEQH